MSKWTVLFNQWEKFLHFTFVVVVVVFLINTYVAQKNHSNFANETSKILAAEKLS